MTEQMVCEVHCIHQEVVDRVRKGLISQKEAEQLAEVFRLLGNPTRIKILHLLSQSMMCVCDLAAATGMSQSAISHQLRLLRASRVVKYRQEGKVVYYSLDDEHVESLFNESLKHIRHG